MRTLDIEFKWYPGFAKVQAQQSIRSLHASAAELGHAPLLEISSKSEDRLGVELSAFNLEMEYGEHKLTVECGFQGSKVFSNGGPYTDLYEASSRDARTDRRLRESGELTAFRFFGFDFPIAPVTAFYDWLYIRALTQNPTLAERLANYQGFTDIAFNPQRSWNCQARSAALYVALDHMGVIEKAMASVGDYLRIIGEGPQRQGEQLRLPLQN